MWTRYVVGDPIYTQPPSSMCVVYSVCDGPPHLECHFRPVYKRQSSTHQRSANPSWHSVSRVYVPAQFACSTPLSGEVRSTHRKLLHIWIYLLKCSILITEASSLVFRASGWVSPAADLLRCGIFTGKSNLMVFEGNNLISMQPRLSKKISVSEIFWFFIVVVQIQ